MTSKLHKLGYRDSFKNGDKNAPILENEMNEFMGNVEEAYTYSRYMNYSFFSGVTVYGKRMIKEAFMFRIMYDDAPMTLLWYHPNGYTRDDEAPVYQADKKSPPVEGQRGGWRHCKWKNKLVKIPDYIEWNSYRRKKDENGKWVRLEKGEPCSNGTRNPIGNGHYTVLPHYEPEGYGKNKYEGDVKSAILASCLDDEDKQELLDEYYRHYDPIRKIDQYFCKKVQDFIYDNKGERNLIEQEIRLHPDLPEPIRDNLLVNLGVMKSEDACYQKEGFYD